MNLKKHKQGIQLCYGVYNEKDQVTLSYLFLVSMNVPEQFFPYTIEFEKISGFIFGLWLYDF